MAGSKAWAGPRRLPGHPSRVRLARAVLEAAASALQ